MLSEDKYFKDLTEAELWQRYCGYLDLSLDEFMEIQKELLMDEIALVADSVLGKKIMGNQKPKSVDEFRRMVPLTTYEDYEPYLSERREDALAIKPDGWCHSSGRSGIYKWVPYSSEFLGKAVKNLLSGFILASTNKKGKVNFSPDSRVLILLPPAPYASGYALQGVAQNFSLQAIPPLEITNIEFQERVKLGFQMALKEGVDVIAAIASVLVKMGEQFSEQAHSTKFSASMLHPRIMGRLLRAWLNSKREKRTILPKDLWPSKAIMTGGVDTTIYRDAIDHFWGNKPLEFYGCVEGSVFAQQAWNKKGINFCPDMVFLEFIPYEELSSHQDDKNYQPSTVLLDGVKEGELYEVVVTQFYGMPLLRYRLKDLVRFTALRDEEAGINLPQMVFQRRVGESINLGALAELDEKTVWQAIASSGIKHTEWSACKEYDLNQSFLRLYFELKEERDITDIERIIDEQLKIIDPDYRDVESYLGMHPVRVTLLSPGTFQRYMAEKRKEGADLAHLKPPHINAPESDIQRLVQLSRSIEE